MVRRLRRKSSAPSFTDPSQNFARFAIKLDRLNDVALPLLIEAADLCKTHVHASYGFELHDKSQYKKLFKGSIWMRPSNITDYNRASQFDTFTQSFQPEPGAYTPKRWSSAWRANH